MKPNRPPTQEEIDQSIKYCQDKFKNVPGVDIAQRRQEALAEGHTDEVCGGCDVVFLAHHHFINCAKTDCPMKEPGKGTILERHLAGEFNKG